MVVIYSYLLDRKPRQNSVYVIQVVYRIHFLLASREITTMGSVMPHSTFEGFSMGPSNVDGIVTSTLCLGVHERSSSLVLVLKKEVLRRLQNNP